MPPTVDENLKCNGRPQTGTRNKLSAQKAHNLVRALSTTGHEMAKSIEGNSCSAFRRHGLEYGENWSSRNYEDQQGHGTSPPAQKRAKFC